MPETISATTPLLSRPLMLIAAILGIVLAATVALLAHYGTAVFYEMIVAGIAACLSTLTAASGHRYDRTQHPHPCDERGISPRAGALLLRRPYRDRKALVSGRAANRGHRRTVQAHRSERANGHRPRFEWSSLPGVFRL